MPHLEPKPHLEKQLFFKFNASGFALLLIIFASSFTISSASQPLTDLHSFRQTQTALTAYWIGHGGPVINYLTPVLGSPWAIPFEFPTYQVIVSFFSNFFNSDLGTTGRIFSFIFLLCCIFPLRKIGSNLELGSHFISYLICLVFSSSVYLYWGRTFMIETLALLLTLTSIALLIDFLKSDRTTILFFGSFFGALAGITKSTTSVTYFICLIVALMYSFFQKKHLKTLGILSLIATYSFFTFAWVSHTDKIKDANPTSAVLDSRNLASWNFGNIGQRFSFDFWGDLVLKRILLGSFGGLAGILILLIFLFSGAWNKSKNIVVFSLILFVAPMLIFANLHIVHWYYQSSNLIFLFAGTSIALSKSLENAKMRRSWKILRSLFLAVVVCNLLGFITVVAPHAYNRSENSDRALLKVSAYIRMHTNPEQGVLIYGQDWSSLIAFYSERKSATLPRWIPNYDSSLTNAPNYFGGQLPGAIVNCFDRNSIDIFPSFDETDEFAKNFNLNNSSIVNNCTIWTK